MCNIGCAVATLVLGTVLVAVSSIVGFSVIPNIVERLIINEVVLDEDTIQFERFVETPFPLNFTLRIFNISNSQDVMNGGVPRVQESGPYVYKLYQTRAIEAIDDDMIKFRFLTRYEFDPEGSFPNTEDDMVTIVNLPYHAILQRAEEIVSPSILGILNRDLDSVFGDLNRPFATVRVGDLIFRGLRICESPGLIGTIACNLIRNIAIDIPNLSVQEDGSVLFSLFGHKNNEYSELFNVYRGREDLSQLGLISQWNEAPSLPFWMGEGSACNMLNGSDTTLYAPFVDRKKHQYAFNADICRSVELRYQYDTEYEGVEVARFAANEWFLDNDDGCFCLNVTAGLLRPNGCLKRGAQEMYSCIGSFLVLTYPHFLFADPDYANMVVGVSPNIDRHRIFLDLEPNTGIVIRGAKRAQINVFLRPVPAITATNNLGGTLTPIFWLEEAIVMPDEFVDEIKAKLLAPLGMVGILVPILIATSVLIFIVGAGFTARAYVTRKNMKEILN